VDWDRAMKVQEVILRARAKQITTVAQLLGHKRLRMAARYQHLSPAFLADAVGRFDVFSGASLPRC